MPPYFLTDYPCWGFRGASCEQPSSPCTEIQVAQMCPDAAWWFWIVAGVTAAIVVERIVVERRAKGMR